jgi:hypothetical protein
MNRAGRHHFAILKHLNLSDNRGRRVSTAMRLRNTAGNTISKENRPYQVPHGFAPSWIQNSERTIAVTQS